MTRRYTVSLIDQCKACGLPVPETEVRFHPVRRWRLDFFWRAHALALEQEGGAFVQGRHVRGVSFEADCEKYAAALLMGIRVLRATPRQVSDGTALNWIEQALKS